MERKEANKESRSSNFDRRRESRQSARAPSSMSCFCLRHSRHSQGPQSWQTACENLANPQRNPGSIRPLNREIHSACFSSSLPAHLSRRFACTLH